MIRKYAFKLALAIIVLSVIGFYEKFQQIRSDRAFSSHGLSAMAEPAGTWAKGQSYNGDLIFQTQKEQTINIPAKSVPALIRTKFRTENTVRVTYLPEEPSKIRFPDAYYEVNKGDLIVPVILFVTGVIALIVLGKKNRRGQLSHSRRETR